MTNYSQCAACGTLIDDVEFGDNQDTFTGSGYELALQAFTDEGTEETIGGMHDGYLCYGCATWMWNALVEHMKQKEEVWPTTS